MDPYKMRLSVYLLYLYITISQSLIGLESDNLCESETFTNSCAWLCSKLERIKCMQVQLVKCVRPSDSFKMQTDLIIIRDRVTQFRYGAFSDLLLLEKIMATSIGLTDLLPSCFINLPNITSLYASFNDIYEIRNNVFEGTNFSRIYLNHNRISHMPRAFQNMDNLKYLTLDYNKLDTLWSHWFSGSKNIEYLSFTHNKIKFIDHDFLKSFPKLRELHLGFNKIFEVAPTLFSRLTHLSVLDLAHNNIETLEVDFFAHHTTILDLNLSMNNITYIPKKLLNKLNVQKLRLLPNPLSCLCMDEIFDWARRNNVVVILPSKDVNINWSNNYPVCVVPLHKHKCDICGDVFGKFPLEYFKNINYSDVEKIQKRTDFIRVFSEHRECARKILYPKAIYPWNDKYFDWDDEVDIDNPANPRFIE